MSRLLIKDEWFEAIASTEYWESEFEVLVSQRAETVFPEYHLVNFKTDVPSEFGVARPDMALIERNYRRWWVLEAELAHHPLKGHVLPQVQRLSSGIYGSEHVDYLMGKAPNLDRDKLRAMMKGLQPRVLVVVNSPCPTWRPELAALGALLSVVEIFRSSRSEHVIRLNGDYPDPPADGLTVCIRDPLVPRFLQVESPAALGDPDPVTNLYNIEYEGAMTTWSRIGTRDRVWLNPTKASFLPSVSRYVLSSEGGRLVLRPYK